MSKSGENMEIPKIMATCAKDLRELKGFGSKALDEVKDKLAELEL